MTRRGAGAALAALLVMVAIGWAAGGDSDPRQADPAPLEAAAAPAESLAARLIDAARGADPVLCALASFAVEGRYGGPAVDPDFEALQGADDEAGATLRWTLSFEADPAAVAALAAALEDPDPCARRLAAIRLGRTSSTEGVGALASATRSADAGARRAAALGLGFVRDGSGAVEETAADALLEAIGDADAGVRATVALSLGRLDADRAIPALVELLEGDPEPAVRRNAALALGEIE